MTGGALLLFRVLAHCMELSWLAAWMIAFAAALLPHPPPLGPAILAFAGAFLLTRLSADRGWLVLSVLALHAGGFLCASAVTLHAVYAPAAPLVDPAWLRHALSATWTAADGWVVCAHLSWTVVFWRGGAQLARRAIDYEAVCARFDRGIAALGLLYVIKWLAPFHGLVVDDPVSHRFLFPFFASSLVAIGVIRLQGGGEKRYAPGYQSVGVLLTFASASLLSAAALVLFLLPYLTVAAQAGFTVLTWAAAASSPFLLWILRLLFAPHTLGTASAPPSPKPPKPEIPMAEPSPSWWMDFIAQLLAWPLRIALIFTVAALVCAAAYLLFCVLVSRTRLTPERRSARNPLRLLLAWLRRLVVRLSAFGGAGSAGWRAHEFYGALLAWARRTGHSRSPAETPREFGARLHRLFPSLAPEIDRIVNAFSREAYREAGLGPDQRSEVAAAWRRLKSPRHWPARTRAWLRR